MFAADAGDYSGCYETYLAAANEIVQHSNDEDIRGILNKAMADVLQLSNPTEQAWGLRVAFDQIKDRGRHGMGSHATAPAAAASPAKSAAVASAGPSTSAEEKEKADKKRRQTSHAQRMAEVETEIVKLRSLVAEQRQQITVLSSAISLMRNHGPEQQ